MIFQSELMMLMVGDLNPNCFAQEFSWMEAFKQAMLQHELIFRNQVRELHRLYWTQKNLMNELYRKGTDVYPPTRCEGLSEEMNKFSESSCTREVLITQPCRNIWIHFLLDRCGTENDAFFFLEDTEKNIYRFAFYLAQNVASLEQLKGGQPEVFSNHPINFSLRFPSNEFVRDICDDLPYGHAKAEILKRDEITDASKRNNHIGGLEGVIVEKDMCHSGFDLEASVELEYHEEANWVLSGFRAPMQKCSSMIMSQPTAFSDQVSSNTDGNDMRHILAAAYVDEGRDGRLQHQKPASSFVGYGDSCIASATFVDHSRVKHQIIKPVLIDLNVPLEDEGHHDLNDFGEDINFKFCSSTLLHDNIHFHEHDQTMPADTSFAPKPISSNSITGNSCENRLVCPSCHDQDSMPYVPSLNSTNKIDDVENTVDAKTLASSCQPQAADCCRKTVDGSTDSSEGAFFEVNVGSLTSLNSFEQGKRDATHSANKRQDSIITSSNSNKIGSHEGSDEDTLSSHAIDQDEAHYRPPSRKLPIGCTSDGEHVPLSNTDESAVTTQLTFSQINGSSPAKLMPVEGDSAIVTAAEVLMGMVASEIFAVPIDHNKADGVEPIEADHDKRDESHRPLLSSDSFECMTLRLCEVQSKDLAISEPLTLAETTGKNVNKITLRRGRGLRDFQREILPGLASLARHEICEDLHNIGHKLRRTASRNARENLFVLPIQGRRSRLYSGQ